MLSKVFLPEVLAVVLVTGSAAVAQSASELLEKGIYTEETVGDLDAAIEIYQKILADAAAQRPFVARARFRLGQCLLKQGKKKEATEAFRKLIKDFPDQKKLVAKARKQVPEKPPFQLQPTPWKDGEVLQFGMKMGGGLDIGTAIWTAQPLTPPMSCPKWPLWQARQLISSMPETYCLPMSSMSVALVSPGPPPGKWRA